VSAALEKQFGSVAAWRREFVAPDAICYNPARLYLYVAIGQPGVISVVDTRGMALAQALPTEGGAHTTAFDRTKQLLYVFLPRRCQAAVYEET